MRDREQEKKIIANTPSLPWTKKTPFDIECDGCGECACGCDVTSNDEYQTAYVQAVGMDSFTNPVTDFIEAASVGWHEDLAWRERAEKILKDIDRQNILCPICRFIGVGIGDNHHPTCELKALIGEVNQ